MAYKKHNTNEMIIMNYKLSITIYTIIRLEHKLRWLKNYNIKDCIILFHKRNHSPMHLIKNTEPVLNRIYFSIIGTVKAA